MHVRLADSSDLPVLASMNWQLIRDEKHSNPMTPAELEQRMRGWLETDYRATLFELDQAIVGYALYRPDETGIYLRQFFIDAEYRRRGHGREAVRQLREAVWPKGARVTVEVLVHNERALRFWRAVGFVDYAVTLKL